MRVLKLIGSSVDYYTYNAFMAMSIEYVVFVGITIRCRHVVP